MFLTKTDGLTYNSWTKNGNDIYQSTPSGNIGIGTNTNIAKHKLIVNGLLSANHQWFGVFLIHIIHLIISLIRYI